MNDYSPIAKNITSNKSKSSTVPSFDDTPIKSSYNNKMSEKSNFEDRPSHNNNFDDIPIKPKTNDFMELLEQNLNDPDLYSPGERSYDENRKIVKRERYKKKDVKPPSNAETKKYKYYSQNFDKNFESNNLVEPVIEEKVDDKKRKKSVSNKNVQNLQNDKQKNAQPVKKCSTSDLKDNTKDSKEAKDFK